MGWVLMVVLVEATDPVNSIYRDVGVQRIEDRV